MQSRGLRAPGASTQRRCENGRCRCRRLTSTKTGVAVCSSLHRSRGNAGRRAAFCHCGTARRRGSSLRSDRCEHGRDESHLRYRNQGNWRARERGQRFQDYRRARALDDVGDKPDAILIGPGMQDESSVHDFVRALLQRTKCAKIVLDAYAMGIVRDAASFQFDGAQNAEKARGGAREIAGSRFTHPPARERVRSHERRCERQPLRQTRIRRQ